MDEKQLQIRALLESLADDYEFINLVNLVSNDIVCWRANGLYADYIAETFVPFPGPEFDRILHDLILPEELPSFVKKVDRDVLMESICEGKKVTVPFTVDKDGIHHYVIEFAASKENASYVIVAFRNLDVVVKDRIEFERQLSEKVEEQTEIIRDSMQRLTSIRDSVIEAMATLVESRDLNTGNHIRNTRKYVEIIVTALQATGTFPELDDVDHMRNIVLASALHDIGKIFVSDMILNKPGKLTDEEYEIIRSHTTLGKEIIDEIFGDIDDPDLFRTIHDIVYSHHEKWDGTGYPQGLAGDAIPLSARIMSVADSLDALLSKRSYKGPYSLETSLSMIKSNAGTAYDGRIVDSLFRSMNQIEQYHSSLAENSSRVSLSGAYSSFAQMLQNKSISSTFVTDYMAAGLCNIDTEEIRLIFINEKSPAIGYLSPNALNLGYLRDVLKPQIHPEDLEELFHALTSDGMKQILQDKNEYTFNYRFFAGKAYKHRQLRMLKVGSEGDECFDVLLGVKDIEESIALAENRVREVLHEETELIKALAKEYAAIYHVNFLTRRVNIYGLDEIAKKRYEPIFQNPNFNLDAFIDKYYISPDVVPEDQDRLRKALAVAHCKEVLKDREEFSEVFQVRRDGINSVFTEVRVFKAEETDGEPSAVVLAFKVVDGEIHREIERLQAVHMASIDGLTGLLNRVTYEKRVDDCFAHAGSAGTAMAYLDLDLFKMVNDTYGHAEGDKILIALAEEMKNVFVSGEYLCRIGGDEFSIFFPQATVATAEERLRALQISMNSRFKTFYPDFRVTVSIGCALCADNGMSFNQLRILSDRRMYQAKLDGGDRVYICHVGLKDAVSIDT